MTNDFTTMCLATFASNYRVIAKSTNIEEEDFEEESNTDTGKKIQLLHNMGCKKNKK